MGVNATKEPLRVLSLRGGVTVLLYPQPPRAGPGRGSAWPIPRGAAFSEDVPAEVDSSNKHRFPLSLLAVGSARDNPPPDPRGPPTQPLPAAFSGTSQSGPRARGHRWGTAGVESSPGAGASPHPPPEGRVVLICSFSFGVRQIETSGEALCRGPRWRGSLGGLTRRPPAPAAADPPPRAAIPDAGLGSLGR